jgi:hypothetical protein
MLSPLLEVHVYVSRLCLFGNLATYREEFKCTVKSSRLVRHPWFASSPDGAHE